MKNTQKSLLIMVFLMVFTFVAFYPNYIYASNNKSTLELIEKTLLDGEELSLENNPVVNDGVIYMSLNDFANIDFSIDNEKTENVIYINDKHSVLSEVKKAPASLTLYLNNKAFKTDAAIFTQDEIIYIPIEQPLESLYYTVVYDNEAQTLSINKLVAVSLSNEQPTKNESVTLTVISDEYNGLPFTAEVKYKTVTTDLSGTVGTPLDFKVGTATAGYKVRIEVKINGDNDKIAPFSFIPK